MRASEYVVDAYALLAFLEREPGYGRIETILRNAAAGEGRVHISAMNLAEVQCQVLRQGRDSARILAAVEALPLNVVPVDSYLPAAVELRARYGVSFASCFAAALAQDLQRPLITGDRAFARLGNELSIEWLR